MKSTEMLDQIPTRVYGEPYQTPDGATVITVARVRGGGIGKAGPVGVFVIRGDHVRWVPAVDANRIALIGVSTGLLAAVIASLAVLRQPPWPQLEVLVDRRHRASQRP